MSNSRYQRSALKKLFDGRTVYRPKYIQTYH